MKKYLLVFIGCLGISIVCIPVYIVVQKKRAQKNTMLFFQHLQQANTLFEQHDFMQAIEYYKKAIAIGTSSVRSLAPCYHNLGLALEQTNHYSLALAAYEKAINIDPNYLNAYLHASTLLQKIQQYPAAHAIIAKAQARHPDNLQIALIEGSILYTEGKLEQAQVAVTAVIKKNPALPQAHIILGAIYEKLNDFQKAYSEYKQAVALEPNNPNHHIAVSDACLGLGNYREWAQEYEWRWQSKPPVNPAIAPRWDGSSLKNKKILIAGENGLGDTIQYLRFIPLLKAQGAHVILLAQKPLKALLKNCAYLDLVITKNDPIPHVDTLTSVMSLPYYFPITQKTIPPTPFLSADKTLINFWKQKLAHDKNFKIGICWHDSPIDTFSIPQARRSMPLETIAQLAQINNISLYSLQKDWPADQLKKYGIKDFGANFDISHGAFMDTVAIMKNLDLVITIDTVTAHLAGALDVPVWVMTPVAADTRWMLNRTDTPWYTHMRFFRQKTMGDWNTVIHAVSTALKNEVIKKQMHT
jgi:tetratricopeptide (TPR) repeat protein